VSILRFTGVEIGPLSRYSPDPPTACSAMYTVSLAFKFGGQTYTFNGIDLLVDDLSYRPGFEGMCLSSVFVLGSVLQINITGTNGPAWLVGDAFLKNVYSVFRSVDVPFIHPTRSIIRCLSTPVPDMRQHQQERSPVQLALLNSAVWMVVS
jgi:hypothetical protein